MSDKVEARKLARGLAYLAPNILGFLAFVLFPLLFSLYMAFSNWDLTLHNMFKDETVRWVGLDNFIRLFRDDNFWRFLGNTLFFMMGIPFSIAGSLIFAILLNQDLGGKSWRMRKFILAGAVLVTACLLLTALGMGATAFTLVLIGLFGLILVGGSLGGNTIYRTLFYTPHFTAGVATFILWKKLYSPHTGPINQALTPVLDGVTSAVLLLPSWLGEVLQWLLLVIASLLLTWSIRRLRRVWVDGEAGAATLWSSFVVTSLPLVCALFWLPGIAEKSVAGLVLLAGLGWLAFQVKSAERLERPVSGKGFGSNFMLAAGIMVVSFVCIGLALVTDNLYVMAATDGGLAPPEWLTDYHWAKPALMIMALWAAVGSNNMILYLAGMSGIPEELYEAASIDGAGPFAKFWNVTWPQLAPVTFFIVVMSVIHGLQGGFEMARTMTRGGPAGATTTLSYFVYTEGFETGRLGFASAVSWALFALVFVVTIINTRFGSRYVND